MDLYNVNPGKNGKIQKQKTIRRYIAGRSLKDFEKKTESWPPNLQCRKKKMYIYVYIEIAVRFDGLGTTLLSCSLRVV